MPRFTFRLQEPLTIFHVHPNNSFDTWHLVMGQCELNLHSFSLPYVHEFPHFAKLVIQTSSAEPVWISTNRGPLYPTIDHAHYKLLGPKVRRPLTSKLTERKSCFTKTMITYESQQLNQCIIL